MHSILTDCPQRDERQGWMNDATVRFEATPYINFDIGRMFPKIVQGSDGHADRGRGHRLHRTLSSSAAFRRIRCAPPSWWRAMNP